MLIQVIEINENKIYIDFFATNFGQTTNPKKWTYTDHKDKVLKRNYICESNGPQEYLR